MAKKFKYELQPSLLDRLTDDKPDTQTESLKERVLSYEQLKNTIKRDLQWLLSTTHYETNRDLSRFPEVKSSVLNYGVPCLSGVKVSSIDSTALAKIIKHTIDKFEPRIANFKVTMALPDEKDANQFDALKIEIVGEVLVTPAPLHIYIGSQFDPVIEKVAVNEVR